MKSRLWQYRWEAWLIIGIPAVAHVTNSILVWPLFSAYYSFAAIIPRFILLVASYYWFGRRLSGKEVLQAFWAYSMISGGIWLIAEGIALVHTTIFYPDIYMEIPFPTPITSIARLSGGLLQILALVWIARQLTRSSLRHGLFLVVFGTFSLGSIHDYFSYSWVSNPLVVVSYLSLLSSFLTLVVSLVRVWILGSFNQRGERWQRNITILLLAATIASLIPRMFVETDVLFGISATAYVAIVLALVYVFRVKDSVKEEA